MSDLQGKTAVVTGASKGIGAGIARASGAAGASVVVNCSASRQEAEALVRDITAGGGRAITVQGSVPRATDVERLLAEAARAFGPLDVLV